MRRSFCFLSLIVLFAAISNARSQQPVRLHGKIVDAKKNAPLPARIYIRNNNNGKWHFPDIASKKGTTVYYKKKRGKDSEEMHTTLSAHPFVIDLPPGKYEVTIERGHEYATLTKTIAVAKAPLNITFKLNRWIDMAKQGWYSGETHVHRSLEELPNIMLAEDLNVAFPLVYWVTQAYAPPRSGARSAKKPPAAKVIKVDKTHLIWPRNTEYEIFTVNKKRHTLGAIFVIGHKSIFEKGVPPVGPVAEQAHAENALLELDKPNWPWSMMLIPIMKVDLYELTNNHIWRTKFAFTNFGVPPPKYMKTHRGLSGFFSENGWIDFNFQNYYVLLNCGFRMRPTAGTASGVHPVPLGFGRVYVHCGKEFTLKNWMNGLNKGRSFVTTGPMLFAKFDGKFPGETFKQKTESREYSVTATIESSHPLQRIEIVKNGTVIRRIKPGNQKSPQGAFVNHMIESVKITSSAWLAVRCFEDRPDGRVRFAHSAPVHIDVAGKPLRPRREEINFLVKRVEDELKRHAGVLPEPALAEYRRGLGIYREIAKKSRED